EQGPEGVAGPQGPQGEPGADGTILADGISDGQVLTWITDNWVAADLPVESVDNMQPSLGLNYIIALTGTFPSRNSIFDPTLGEIMLFAGTFAPRGWALCDGQLLSIAQNQALFSLLGTTYGGDGRTTFALPDLRGRSAVHAGTGPGLTPRFLGQKFGAESTMPH
uniref:phage tail protein n=1 Tax=Granulosicoccus sp. 3-233 TaxID=3417969 RepID=UPI003D334D21